MSFFIPSFAVSPSPTQSPVTTYVRVQPLQLHLLEWCIQIVLMYVVVRDFFMYVVPWVTRVVSVWVLNTFPKTYTVLDDVVDDAVEGLDTFVAGKAEQHKESLDDALEHVGEQLMGAASAGGVGLVKRLVAELS